MHKHNDCTLIIHHKLDDQEIQDIIQVIEEKLKTMGIWTPIIDVTVSA